MTVMLAVLGSLVCLFGCGNLNNANTHTHKTTPRPLSKNTNEQKLHFCLFCWRRIARQTDELKLMAATTNSQIISAALRSPHLPTYLPAGPGKLIEENSNLVEYFQAFQRKYSYDIWSPVGGKEATNQRVRQSFSPQHFVFYLYNTDTTKRRRGRGRGEANGLVPLSVLFFHLPTYIAYA